MRNRLMCVRWVSPGVYELKTQEATGVIQSLIQRPENQEPVRNPIQGQEKMRHLD